MVHQSDNTRGDDFTEACNSQENAATSSLEEEDLARSFTRDGDNIVEAHNSQENEATSSLEEEDLARSFADHLTGLRSRSLLDIHIEDLVFCQPSMAVDPSIPPPLQTLAGTNAQYLEYRDWIINLYLETIEPNLVCDRSEHCRALRNKLLDELRIEWAKLDELKLRAWQMAPQKSSGEPPCSNPNVMDLDSAQVIDTCGCL